MKTVTESGDLDCKRRSRRGSHQICFRSRQHFKGKHRPAWRALIKAAHWGWRPGGAGRRGGWESRTLDPAGTQARPLQVSPGGLKPGVAKPALSWKTSVHTKFLEMWEVQATVLCTSLRKVPQLWMWGRNSSGSSTGLWCHGTWPRVALRADIEEAARGHWVMTPESPDTAQPCGLMGYTPDTTGRRWNGWGAPSLLGG